MLRALSATVIILFSGCAAPVHRLNVVGIERSESVRVNDLRPSSERQQEMFSSFVGSDAYAISRVADESFSPSAIRLLQHRVYEKFAGAVSAPLEVTVHHLVVYQNRQAEFRDVAFGAGFGSIGLPGMPNEVSADPSGVVTSLVDTNTFASLSSKEFARAVYSQRENPGRGSVIVVYIETEIGGRRVFSRALAPAKQKGSEAPFALALESAVRHHVAQY